MPGLIFTKNKNTQMFVFYRST